MTPFRWDLVTPDRLGGPRHDDHTRQALAEAVALVAYGRSRAGRAALARARRGASPPPGGL